MTKEEAIAENQLRWIGIDLDKTLATNSPYPEYRLLEPVKGAKEALEQLNADGWKIVIYTSRPWMEHEQIENWLDRYNIPYKRIVCGKLFVKWLVDDRAIQFKGDWKETLKDIK